MKVWFRRWQEYVIALPLVALIAVVSWGVLGKLGDRDDLIRWLLELPVLCGYALAAAGLTLIVCRRSRRNLSDDEATELWKRVLDAQPGALVAFGANEAKVLIVYALTLAFFWPDR